MDSLGLHPVEKRQYCVSSYDRGRRSLELVHFACLAQAIQAYTVGVMDRVSPPTIALEGLTQTWPTMHISLLRTAMKSTMRDSVDAGNTCCLVVASKTSQVPEPTVGILLDIQTTGQLYAIGRRRDESTFAAAYQ